MLRAEPKHAAFAISAWKRLAKLLTESGLTPRGRVGLIAVPLPGEEGTPLSACSGSGPRLVHEAARPFARGNCAIFDREEGSHMHPQPLHGLSGAIRTRLSHYTDPYTPS